MANNRYIMLDYKMTNDADLARKRRELRLWQRALRETKIEPAMSRMLRIEARFQELLKSED